MDRYTFRLVFSISLGIAALSQPSPPPSCTPLSAIACTYACGTVSDRCGGWLDCGTCDVGQACVNNACVCDASTCEREGYDCGEFLSSAGFAANGAPCGEILHCGTCSEDKLCVNNVCTCIPTTCEELTATCGSWDNGCDGLVRCGSATISWDGCPNPTINYGVRTPGEWCDPNAAPGERECTCKSATCEEKGTILAGGIPAGALCSPKASDFRVDFVATAVLSDDCGGTLDCGSCYGTQQACGEDYRCTCIPTTCEIEQKNCGRISDGCPGPGALTCGTCAANEVCSDEKICECVESTCENEQAECGLMSDGCGYPHQTHIGSFGDYRDDPMWLRPLVINSCGTCAATSFCNGTINATLRALAGAGAPVYVGKTSCIQCGDGHEPNPDQTGCDPCPPGSAGTGGVCAACSLESPQHVPNEYIPEVEAVEYVRGTATTPTVEAVAYQPAVPRASYCVCIPVTCEQVGATCGARTDGCGGELDCGMCGTNTWGGQNACVDNVCVCTPFTCDTAPVRQECGPSAGRVQAKCVTKGATCGTITDGCANDLDCGTCFSNSTSGYEEMCSIEHKCECVPTTCEQEGINCGTIGDRCGGSLECGKCGDDPQEGENACRMTLFQEGMPQVAHLLAPHLPAQHHTVVPSAREAPVRALVPSELTIYVGDSLDISWNPRSPDHLHVAAYIPDPTAECPSDLSSPMDSEDVHYFGSEGRTSEFCNTNTGRVVCTLPTQHFPSDELPSLPRLQSVQYHWPSPPILTYEPQTPPTQSMAGTYCVGTVTNPTVRLTLRVTVHECDITRVGRGSLCDTDELPVCNTPEVPFILLPSLAPLEPMFANSTCEEMLVLLSYFGVQCDSDISRAVPELVRRNGGDGTLQSLCPITCGLCPHLEVDENDYGISSETCHLQNDTCHMSWVWPDETRECVVRRFTEFDSGGETCTPETSNDTAPWIDWGHPPGSFHPKSYTEEQCAAADISGDESRSRFACEFAGVQWHDASICTYIPFDWDSSGTLNASYARPLPGWCVNSAGANVRMVIPSPEVVGADECSKKCSADAACAGFTILVNQGSVCALHSLSDHDGNLYFATSAIQTVVTSQYTPAESCLEQVSATIYRACSHPIGRNASGALQMLSLPLTGEPAQNREDCETTFNPAANEYETNKCSYVDGQTVVMTATKSILHIDEDGEINGDATARMCYRRLTEPESCIPTGAVPWLGYSGPGTCSCSPTTCALQGFDCGHIDDHCGGQLFCGQCNATAGDACYDNVCSAYRPEPEPEPEPEPNDFFCENGHVYEYVQFPSSWDEARAEAERMGSARSHSYDPDEQTRGIAYLATIVNELEQQCINQLLDADGNPPTGWTGGRGNNSEGRWWWEKDTLAGVRRVTYRGDPVGEVFNYTNWGKYELFFDTPGKDYIALNFAEGYNPGEWTKVYGSYSGLAKMPGFFLEYEPTRPLPEPEPEPEPNAVCPPGSMPTADRLDCILCSDITETFCLGDLHPTQPIDEEQPEWTRDAHCVNASCVDGGCVSEMGAQCRRCWPGSGGNEERTKCKTCVSKYSADGELCRPCEPGWQPNWLAGGVSCISCATLGNKSASEFGLRCEFCVPGQMPREDRGKCLECGLWDISDGTRCERCPSGMHPGRNAWQVRTQGMYCELMHVELALAVDVSTWDNETRQTFELEFAEDAARLAGVPPSRIRILELHAGSTVVIWEVIPSGTIIGGNLRPSGVQPPAALLNFQSALTPSSTFAGYSIAQPYSLSVIVLVGNVNECVDERPCAHGTCLQRIGSYSCRCDPGWDGFHCDIDINECLSGPCQNGATCGEYNLTLTPSSYLDLDNTSSSFNETVTEWHAMKLVNAYACDCVPGWECHNCECDKDECSSHPCMNGGSCEDSHDLRWHPAVRQWAPVSAIDAFNCTCAAGYTSSGNGTCDIDIDECYSAPCLNGATCYTDGMVDMYGCICVAGWEGHNCELDIDECRSDPCDNHAPCSDGPDIDTYTCSCIPGYGVTDKCEVDLDECASAPCKFGAECTDSSGDPDCSVVGMVSCLACAYGVGDGTGGSDIFLGDAPGPVECAGLVRVSHPEATGATYATVAPRWTRYYGFWCGEENTLGSYASRAEAEAACTALSECKSIYDQSCDDMDEWYTCSATETEFKPNSRDSCMYLKAGACYAEINATGKRLDADWQTCQFSRACVPVSEAFPYCVVPVLAYQCECRPGWTGVDCDVDLVECDSNPCNNDGECSESSTNPQIPIDSYGCSCARGFEGLNCEIDIDECISDPCVGLILNNCVDYVDSYVCACPDGFQGHNCEEDYDECESRPCFNSGTCSHEFGVPAFTCDCPTGFIGHQCETDVDDCESRPCYRDGSCEDKIDAYKCYCVAGWEGVRCQADVDECRSNPCRNNAWCSDQSSCMDRSSCMFDEVSQVDAYTCRCRVGFHGPLGFTVDGVPRGDPPHLFTGNCESNFDECASNPCIHMEPCKDPNVCDPPVCNDGPGDYVCTCRPGTGGKNCDRWVDSYDPCLKDPECVWWLIWGSIFSFLGVVGIPCTTYAVCTYLQKRRKAICQSVVKPFSDIQQAREERRMAEERRLRRLAAKIRRSVNANRVQLTLTFKRSDTDQSGTLDTKELATILAEFGVKNIEQKELKWVLQSMDADGDADVSYEEFLHYFEGTDDNGEFSDLSDFSQSDESYSGSEDEDGDNLVPVPEPDEEERIPDANCEKVQRDATLTVRLVKCVKLIGADSSRTSDPYVELNCGGNHPTFKSSVKKKSLDPEYGELFQFSMFRQEDWVLSVAVKDKDMDADDLLGGVDIDMRPFLREAGGWGAFTFTRRWPLTDTARSAQGRVTEVSTALLETWLEVLRIQGKYTVPNPYGLIELELTCQPNDLPPARTPTPEQLARVTRTPPALRHWQERDSLRATIATMGSNELRAYQEEHQIPPWPSLTADKKFDYLVRIAVQYGPFDWLDAEMADAARMYVERGRFTYDKYVSDWTTKFLYKMGWKLDGRYTAMAKEDLERAEFEEMAATHQHVTRGDQHTIDSVQQGEPWRLVPSEMLAMPNLADPGIIDATNEFGSAASNEDLSDDEMSELGRDPARWFIESNPHAATATGGIHLPDPDSEYYDSGHGRLEAALADGRFWEARANPRRLIDKPVAVHKHSPRKLAAAAKLLPHIRFLQTPEALQASLQTSSRSELPAR